MHTQVFYIEDVFEKFFFIEEKIRICVCTRKSILCR
jgi:hypothetical protein